MRPLVIVRPEPGASATAMAAEQLGLEPLVMPLFAVEPLGWRAPAAADFDGILLTSANAVRHGGAELKRLQSLPAHCVGEATATAARDSGFPIGATGRGGVDELLALLPPELRLLHLCGSDRRQPDAPRQTIHAIPVYKAAELPAPKSLSELDSAVIAVHSPRSASRLSQVADQLRLRRDSMAIVAISGEAAAAAGEGWESVATAADPTDPALLALAASLCNNS